MARYRSERDALRHRADQLQDELRDAEARLGEAEGRLAEHVRKDEEEEKQLAYLRSEVERLRVKAGELPAPPGASKRPLAFAALGALLVTTVVAGVGFFLATGHEENVEVPVPAAVESEPAVAPAPKVEPQIVLFGAEVVSAQGAKVEVGDACIIEAVLGGGSRVNDLEVRCGQVLYDAKTARGSGTETYNGRHIEMKAGDDVYRYKLFYARRGTWTGPRPQIDINSYHHRARIWREGADAWSVTLHIDALSFPRQGAPLGVRSTLSGVPQWRWPAKRVKVDGAPPRVWNSAPEDCEVTVLPSTAGRSSDGSQIDCRATVRCGPVIYYGEGDFGFTHCPVKGPVLGLMVDDGSTEKNGDPELRIDPEAGEAVVADTIDGVTFSAHFALQPPADCLPGPLWAGAVSTKQGREPYRIEVKKQSIAFGKPGATVDSDRGPVRCGGGALPLSFPGAPHLMLGPGGMTLGGFTANQDAVALRHLDKAP